MEMEERVGLEVTDDEDVEQQEEDRRWSRLLERKKR